ncbi:MAG: hypothetical protein H6Q05_1621, partial [Acidobacteria bacterium]|nr:hypothetical protein [Acidobacteriota bacterium]
MTSLVIILAAVLLGMPQAAGTQGVAGTIEKGDFRFAYDERGISGLANPHDPFGATLMPAGAAAGGRGGRGAGTGSATLGLNIRRAEVVRVAGHGHGHVRQRVNRLAAPGCRDLQDRWTCPRLDHRRGVIGQGAGADRRSRHRHSRGRAFRRKPDPDIRAGLPAASVHLRAWLVLLFCARFGRPSLSAGDRAPW